MGPICLTLWRYIFKRLQLYASSMPHLDMSYFTNNLGNTEIDIQHRETQRILEDAKLSRNWDLDYVQTYKHDYNQSCTWSAGQL